MRAPGSAVPRGGQNIAGVSSMTPIVSAILAGSYLRAAAMRLIAIGVIAIASPLAAVRAQPADDPASRHLYNTGGVHNDVGCKPPSTCLYKRAPGEPTDPLYSAWWSSDWTMYRVFQNYDKFPPPYASPP